MNPPKQLKGSYDMAVKILKVALPSSVEGAEPAQHVIVIKHFKNISKQGKWNMDEMSSACDQNTALYSLDRCGMPPACKSPNLAFRYFFEKAGGWTWSTWSVEVPDEASRANQQAFDARTKKSDWILKEVSQLASNDHVVLTNWVNAQPQKLNEHSQSHVKDWSAKAIWEILAADKKNRSGCRPVSTCYHTILSLDAPGIPDFLRILQASKTFGVFFVGLAGTGKTSALRVMLMSRSRQHEGTQTGQYMEITHMDALRGKELDGAHPVFLDDSAMKKSDSSFLKHYFGIPTVQIMQFIPVRFEFAGIASDCPRAATNNPIDSPLARSTRPEDMTWDTLRSIIRVAIDDKIDEMDADAVFRRCAIQVYAPSPSGRTVVYTSIVNPRFAAKRDLTYFYLNGHDHIFKPGLENVEADHDRLGDYPEDYWAHVAVEQKIVAACLSGEVADVADLDANVYGPWLDGLASLREDMAQRLLPLPLVPLPAVAAPANPQPAQAVAMQEDVQVQELDDAIAARQAECTIWDRHLESLKRQSTRNKTNNFF